MGAGMDQLFSGQTRGITLLLLAGVLFLYFLPSVLSFMRGQKRFWIVFPLNVAVTFVQSALLQLLAPALLVAIQGDITSMILVVAVVGLKARDQRSTSVESAEHQGL
jgi:hypothetical protein